MLTGCKKNDSFIDPSSQVPAEASRSQSNARPTAVTFTLTRGLVTASGAINLPGTYTMNPVIKTGQAYHCTNNLVTTEGTITALTNCYDGSTGTWRIISGTQAFMKI